MSNNNSDNNGDNNVLEDHKKEILKLLKKTGAAKFSLKKEFKLASGVMSDHYFDLRVLCGEPDGIRAVASALYHMTRHLYDDDHDDDQHTMMPKSVGGLESGSISIATAISYKSAQMQQHDSQSKNMPSLSSFFVRKNRKEHGTQKMIEGVINGPVVVIVDDVITSGDSALKAVNAVRKAGFKCDYLLCIVYRGTDEQKREIEKVASIRYLLTSNEIIKYLKDTK